MMGKTGYAVAMIASCLVVGCLIGLVFNAVYGVAA